MAAATPAGGAGPDGTGRAGASAPSRRWRVRQVINTLNLSTPLGVAVALAGRARLVRGPRGLILAEHYRGAFPAPRAPGVTIGNVVLLRMSARAALARPGLVDHESRHATQYAFWVGPLGFVPAYLAASAWSWLRCRNFALGNPFEVRAGLVDGGYLPPAPIGSPDRDENPGTTPRTAPEEGTQRE